MMTKPNFDEVLAFAPLYQQRVWGGRALEGLGRQLPDSRVFGESWDLVDRPEAQSVVARGAFAGRDLQWLWRHYREALFGAGCRGAERFPLLFKLLDARESLSVQVHPSEAAGELGFGEPKSEWWYVLAAQPGAEVFAGFKHGITRQDFEHAISRGEVEPLLHRIPVSVGDSLFVPSGRCHAIGAGCLIAEVQQNSDTTYRVFDWNRVGSDGVPRALHVRESLECINFADVQPRLCTPLAEQAFVCDYFSIAHVPLERTLAAQELAGSAFLVVEGCVSISGATFERGDWFVVPAQVTGLLVEPTGGSAALLRIDWR